RRNLVFRERVPGMGARRGGGLCRSPADHAAGENQAVGDAAGLFRAAVRRAHCLVAVSPGAARSIARVTRPRPSLTDATLAEEEPEVWQFQGELSVRAPCRRSWPLHLYSRLPCRSRAADMDRAAVSDRRRRWSRATR